MNGPLFYLGTPEPSWLQRARNLPLFVSRRRLARRKRLPQARVPWALDSGGFNEVTDHGGWVTTVQQYLDDVARYDREVGHLEWAAPMDWMCEAPALAATGLTIGEHQRRTVENYPELLDAWPQHSDATCPFVPVLQGGDYLRCIELYQAAGVDLTAVPLVGIGSVCREEDTDRIGDTVQAIADALPGVPLHGFGVKAGGLRRYGHLLASSDSQAWSRGARYRDVRTPDCTHRGACSWCPRAALAWRRDVIGRSDYAWFPEFGEPPWSRKG